MGYLEEWLLMIYVFHGPSFVSLKLMNCVIIDSLGIRFANVNVYRNSANDESHLLLFLKSSTGIRVKG